MRIIAVTQARTGSTRLPGKVLMRIGDQTLLDLHIRRILDSKKINELILATTISPEDAAIETIGNRYGIFSYRGSINDVLDRFYQCLKGKGADYVVRLTADCPLIDPALIDNIISYTLQRNLDYCSNTLEPSYPDGQDVEVFRFSALQKAWEEATLASEREHVTPYIWKNSSFKGGKLFSSDNFDEKESFGHLRMTVDEPADFELIKRIVNDLGNDRSWYDYAQYLESNRDIKAINETIGRNEGYSNSLTKDNPI